MRNLSSKIIAIQVLFLVVAPMSIGLTLLVPWQLDGGAAAIDDAGSLRMRAYRLAFLLADSRDGLSPAARRDRAADLNEFDSVLATLRRGDPARPLLLPANPQVAALFAGIEARRAVLRAVAQRAVDGLPAALAREGVAAFVEATNVLAFRIEDDLARGTNLLSMFQLRLVGLAIAGAIALVYLALTMIILPLQCLREGMQRMAAADFSVRLPAGGRDEFGQLAAGFNHMAERLRDLYDSLESRVQDKTRSLALRNA